MSAYDFKAIESKWQRYWEEQQTNRVTIDSNKPKYYVLDMFPYPSGAGLHVGHPLGYIASDIVSRYKTLKGFNVLHPMGFDAFGLPAEQYAIQTGQHPAITTEENIQRYKEQLQNLGLSFDWNREFRTSEPDYYKWTQWIFLKLFHSWYNNATDQAEPIDQLITVFEKEGNHAINASTTYEENFSANEWQAYSEKEKQEILLHYRLAYLDDTTVNWCPALGTVLANEEVKDGLSERGGHPVVRKKMKQWSLRITAYAERLLTGLEIIDWPEPVVEMQRNWIGKSVGAEIDFTVTNSASTIKVFSTRPDTIFGATFMVLAPEHELVQQITTDDNRNQVEAYVTQASNRSERDRMSDVKNITGTFTGAYATHPFTGKQIPIWIADYVLAGYGTGAVMAVPAHDSRDYAFAKHFELPIIEVISGGDISSEAYETKDGTLVNSDFLNGLNVQDALKEIISQLEAKSFGKGQTNYRLRDAIFSRQRYWGEPFPIYYKDEVPYTLPEDQLPLRLPEVDAYKPTETGEPPLARAQQWETPEGYSYEASTMPGWAGSSWYFLRYMDPKNPDQLASNEALNYWQQVDLYMGGSEHATGHLLYARFWNKFLKDLGLIAHEEPFKKLINQGMIQGRSSLAYRLGGSDIYVSKSICKKYEQGELTNKAIEELAQAQGITSLDTSNIKFTPIHVDVSLVSNDILDIEAFKNWRPELANASFLLEDGQYHCGYEIEKMSKRWFNVVNPDDVTDQYGTDSFRLYEMFLGPIEQSKPWDTKNIDGVSRFLKKLWRLFFNNEGQFDVSLATPEPAELKILHKTLKKLEEDIERFSFNTCVSAFMIAVNELTSLKCNKQAILEPLVIALAPFAPHMCEELWEKLGHTTSVTRAIYPQWDESYLKEDMHEYPVSVNGKMREKISFPDGVTAQEVEAAVVQNETIAKWLDGKQPKKIIFVPKRIINVVV